MIKKIFLIGWSGNNMKSGGTKDESEEQYH